MLPLTTSCLQRTVDLEVLPHQVQVLAIDVAEGSSITWSLHDIIKPMAHHSQLSRTISAMAGQELILVMEGSGGPDHLVRLKSLVPGRDATVEVDSAAVRIPAIETESRVVVPMIDERSTIPGRESDAGVCAAVVIPKVERPATRTHEQVDHETRHANREPGPIVRGADISVSVQGPTEPYGAEQDPTTGKAVIPISGHEDIPTRGVGVLTRHPHVIGLTGHVVPRRPLVVIRCIDPVPGDPLIVRTGSGHVRPNFQRGGRLGNVRQILHLSIGPEPADPLMAACHSCPITRDPAATGGHIAPDPTHPQVVLRLRVPAPVTGDPLDVIARGCLLGRQLIHDRRRVLSNHFIRDGVQVVHISERLMHGTTREGLHVGVGNREIWIGGGQIIRCGGRGNRSRQQRHRCDGSGRHRCRRSLCRQDRSHNDRGWGLGHLLRANRNWRGRRVALSHCHRGEPLSCESSCRDLQCGGDAIFHGTAPAVRSG